MKISYNWLQKYFKEKLPEPNDIARGIIFYAFEIEEQEKVGDDTIFDIKILPDRAHDCLSHWGIAKEISAIFNIKIDKDESEKYKILDGDEGLSISVLDDNCRRYMGRVIKGVKVGPSPAWLSEALISIGQKSINNIVDATNYVMFDLGNPIHAFDLDKLASPKIIVDKAKQEEEFTLLDGREVILDESMLTIRDEKDVLVIAGVKGGKKAEIDNNTTNIMIEVANFNPTTVRKTAKKLGIFTDSSKRFENEISPILVPLVMDKITSLILEISGGDAYKVVDIYKGDEEAKNILFTKSYINNILGVNISKETIEGILGRFNYEYKSDGDNFEIKVFPLRLDMSGPHDVAEEIGRIYGYDKVISVLPKIDFKIKENQTWVNINSTRNYFMKEGYREVMNYAFASKGDVEIMASASDKNFMRTNLTDGMKKTFELNKLNISFLGDKEIKIFEIGTVFSKDKETINVCFANKKEVKEMSLDEFVKTITDVSEIKIPHSSNNFKPWSLYPFITRDIAVWVPESTEPNTLFDIYKELGTNLLIKDPELVDKFQKQDKVSYAYRLVFQSYDRTLTDEEIIGIMSKITEKITSLGFEVR